MNRGEIWLANLDPVQGSEQAGTRPVLVIQAAALSALLRTTVVVPFASNLRWAKFPFCVLVQAGDGGLQADSVALGHQVRVCDKARLRTRWGTVSDATLASVEQALRLALGT